MTMNRIRTRQTDRVLDYMKQFGSITQVEAISDLGVYRLASRISDLKDMGIRIEKVMESGVNRFGEKTSYARYRLGEQGGSAGSTPDTF